MLEQITLGQFLQWLTVGGGLAILLQRIPGFEGLPSILKVGTVTLLNFIAPAVFVALQVYVPPSAMDSTIAVLIFGAFSLVAAFVVHKLDDILASLSLLLQAKVAMYFEDE